jgi:pimeloyl-ACP methyl ester carboxylesterase
VYARAFQSALPGADLVMIREAGHMVAFEKTAEVSAAIDAAYRN